MGDEPALRRPIGWWLKEADARLDAAFDRRLQGRDVDRRGWQLLASLARQPASRSELVESLAAFDPPEVIERVVDDLASREWIEESGGLLRLTRAGESEQAALAPLVDEVRREVASALPQEDYVTLVRLLERLVTGLRVDT
ncbi:MAG TPA: hypothetical protein VGR21_09830 [Cryptosporangiaceae bacterium]|nr:hypothetical protein [Cryptosporangiaceae bacterium]